MKSRFALSPRLSDVISSQDSTRIDKELKRLAMFNPVEHAFVIFRTAHASSYITVGREKEGQPTAPNSSRAKAKFLDTEVRKHTYDLK